MAAAKKKLAKKRKPAAAPRPKRKAARAALRKKKPARRAKLSSRAARKSLLGRVKVPSDAQLDLVFQKDYQARDLRIFESPNNPRARTNQPRGNHRAPGRPDGPNRPPHSQNAGAGQSAPRQGREIRQGVFGGSAEVADAGRPRAPAKALSAAGGDFFPVPSRNGERRGSSSNPIACLAALLSPAALSLVLTGGDFFSVLFRHFRFLPKANRDQVFASLARSFALARGGIFCRVPSRNGERRDNPFGRVFCRVALLTPAPLSPLYPSCPVTSGWRCGRDGRRPDVNVDGAALRGGRAPNVPARPTCAPVFPAHRISAQRLLSSQYTNSPGRPYQIAQHGPSVLLRQIIGRPRSAPQNVMPARRREAGDRTKRPQAWLEGERPAADRLLLIPPAGSARPHRAWEALSRAGRGA